MNDATVRFGYDGAQLTKGLAEQERRLNSFAGRAEQSLRRAGGGGGGSRYMGQVAMQAQDIAVQLQSGTKASIVLAQQGSQILSAFGAGGAIAGGALAIGASIYTMRQKGEEAFQALKKESAEFDQSLRTISSGGITDMINGMEGMKDRAKELNKEVAEMTEPTRWNAVKNYLSPIFNPNRDEEIAAKQKLALKNEEGRRKIIQQIVTASDEELRILELKNQGNADAAQALEDQVELRRELARIADAPEEVRGKLRENLEATFAAREQSRAMQKQKHEREAAQAQQAEIQRKRESLAMEYRSVEVLEMQARGRDRLAKKMQEQEQLARRSRELMGMGLDPEAAISLATREQKAQKALEFRQRTGRSKIGGVGERRMMGFGGLDALAALQRKEEIPLNVRTPAGVRGARVGTDGHFYGGYAPVGSDPLSTRGQRRGRMMGGDGGALSTRAAVSVGGSAYDAQRNLQQSRGDSKSGSADSVPQLLSQLVKISQRGFFGS